MKRGGGNPGYKRGQPLPSPSNGEFLRPSTEVIITKILTERESYDRDKWIMFTANDAKTYCGSLTIVNPFTVMHFVRLKFMNVGNVKYNPERKNFKFEESELDIDFFPLTLKLMIKAYEISNWVSQEVASKAVKGAIIAVLKEDSSLRYVLTDGNYEDQEIDYKIIQSSSILIAAAHHIGYYRSLGVIKAAKVLFKDKMPFANAKQIDSLVNKLQRNPYECFFRITTAPGFNCLSPDDIEATELQLNFRFDPVKVIQIKTYNKIIDIMKKRSQTMIRESEANHFIGEYFKDELKGYSFNNERPNEAAAKQIESLLKMDVLRRFRLTDPENLSSTDFFLVDTWVAHNEDVLVSRLNRLLKVPIHKIMHESALKELMTAKELGHMSFDQIIALIQGLSEGFLFTTGLAGGGKSYVELLQFMIQMTIFPQRHFLIVTPTVGSCEGLYRRATEMIGTPQIAELLEKLSIYQMNEPTNKDIENEIQRMHSEMEYQSKVPSPEDMGGSRTDAETNKFITQWAEVLGARENRPKTIVPPFKPDTKDPVEKRIIDQWITCLTHPDTPIIITGEAKDILKGYLGPANYVREIARIQQKIYGEESKMVYSKSSKTDKGKSKEVIGDLSEVEENSDSEEEDDDAETFKIKPMTTVIDSDEEDSQLMKSIPKPKMSVGSSSNSINGTVKKKLVASTEKKRKREIGDEGDDKENKKKKKDDWVSVEMRRLLDLDETELPSRIERESTRDEGIRRVSSNFFITTPQYMIHRNSHNRLEDWVGKISSLIVDEQMLSIGDVVMLLSMIPNLRQLILVGDSNQLQTMEIASAFLPFLARLEHDIPELKEKPKCMRDTVISRVIVSLLMNQRVLAMASASSKSTEKEDQDKIALIEGIRGILDSKVPTPRKDVIELIDLEKRKIHLSLTKIPSCSLFQAWMDAIIEIKKNHFNRQTLFVTTTHDMRQRINKLIVYAFYSPAAVIARRQGKMLPLPTNLREMKFVAYPGVCLSVTSKVIDSWGNVFNNGYNSIVRAIFIPEKLENLLANKSTQKVVHRKQALKLTDSVILDDYYSFRSARILMQDGKIIEGCDFPVKSVELREASTVRVVQGMTSDVSVFCFPLDEEERGKEINNLGIQSVYTGFSRASKKVIGLRSETMPQHIRKPLKISRYNRLTWIFDFDGGKHLEPPRFVELFKEHIKELLKQKKNNDE